MAGNVAAVIVAAVLLVFVLIVLAQAVRIVPQARAGVVERLGRYSRTLEPGLHFIFPFVDRLRRPLVGIPGELEKMRALVVETAEEVIAEYSQRDGRNLLVKYTVGTMIELPRACLLAGEIAAHADFFSFGTNDLTQTALGLSRDDAGRFLAHYLEIGVLERDPFETIDQGGVGDLMRLAVERGRGEKPALKLGICGEHGGEPKSVAFCHALGLDYVSCSPFRVPLARLAAAQAALAESGVTAAVAGG